VWSSSQKPLGDAPTIREADSTPASIVAASLFIPSPPDAINKITDFIARVDVLVRETAAAEDSLSAYDTERRGTESGAEKNAAALAANSSRTLVALADVRADALILADFWRELSGPAETLNKVLGTSWMSACGRTTRAALQDFEAQLSAASNAARALPGARAMSAAAAVVRGALPLLSEFLVPALRTQSSISRLWAILALHVPLEACTVGTFLRAAPLLHEAALRQLVRSALGEARVSAFFTELEESWDKMSWEHGPSSHGISNWSSLLETAGEQAASLGALHSSPHFAAFRERALAWEARLAAFISIGESWADAARSATHLRGLFSSSPDVALALPDDALRFSVTERELSSLAASLLENAPNPLALPVAILTKNSTKIVGVGAARCGEGSSAILVTAPADGDVRGAIDAAALNLSRVAAGLAAFLAARRNAFARFFFLPDADLLQVLSCATDAGSPTLARHLSKLWAAVGSFRVNPDGDVVGVTSVDDESVCFRSPVSVARDGSPMHVWLAALEVELAGTLASVTVRTRDLLTANSPSGASLCAALKSGPVQAVLLAAWIHWTSRVENALSDSRDTLSNVNLEIAEWISALSGTCVSSSVGVSERRIAEQCLLETLHKRDVTTSLAAERALLSSVADFAWTSRLRAYADSHRVTVRSGIASLPHGFEYVGVGERLVVTPLTDRAFFALSHALALRRGGAPAGPAGTGKTETVKALGGLIGRRVVVFNCDETFDTSAIGRILEGVARSGTFLCFDEFNRLEEGVLSAVSTSISAIQAALAAGAETLEFPGAPADMPRSPLNPSVGIFITMNPGYAGRSVLPENVKALFRPVAMVAPDSTLIAAATLSLAGFNGAQSLAAAVVSLFSSAATRLSVAPHYDWGLRALKTVLIAARSRLVDARNTGRVGADAEVSALSSAVAESVLPKLAPADIAIWTEMARSAFPGGFSAASLGSALLARAIVVVAEARGLEWRRAAADAPNSSAISEKGPLAVLATGCAAALPHPALPPNILRATPLGEMLLQSIPDPSSFAGEWFQKVVQVSEGLAARHGVMLVGPGGSGKSSALRVLSDALQLVDGVRTDITVLHPKCLLAPGIASSGGGGSHEQLYGRLDATTGEWRDGILTATLRAILSDVRGESSRRHWIILDGDVDPGWAEGLNSVLDDNKVLTLPSGERLPLPSNIRIVFETDVPRSATLATVSRAGMIAFSDSSLPRDLMLAAFLRALRGGRPHMGLNNAAIEDGDISKLAGIADALAPILRRGGLADRVLSWSTAGFPHVSSTPVFTAPPAALVRSFLALLRSGLDAVKSTDAAHVVAVALTALQSSAGAPHNEAFRIALAAEIVRAPEAAAALLPASGMTLYDACFSASRSSWIPWSSSLATPRELPPDAVLDTSLVIPTVDAARVTAALRGWLAARSPLILAGPPGSGKTLLINAALASLPDTRAAWLSFSASTNPEGVLTAIESHCEYVPRGSDGSIERWDLRPIGTPDSWLAVFADEVNLPARDSYGCARALDFLRSLIDTGGFWAPLRLRGMTAPSAVPRPSGACRAWVSLRRVQFLGACNPPAGDADASRGALPSRLLGAAPVFYVGYSSAETLAGIFGVLMRALSRLHPCLPPLAEPLTAASLSVWRAAASRYGPRAAPDGDSPQCVYSPRELSRWLRSLYSGLAPLAGVNGGASITPKLVLQLWHYEGSRLFAARLSEDVEVAWVHSELSEALKTALKANVVAQRSQLQRAMMRPLVTSRTGPVLAAALLVSLLQLISHE
jgi:dynein heavy chain 1, cytosolic